MCVGVVGCCRCCPGGVLTAEGGGPRHSWRRFPCASLAGGLAGWQGWLGVLVADGVLPGGVAVVAVVDAPGCCW